MSETIAKPQTSHEAVDKLATALAKAQGEFPTIPKDSEVVVHRKDAPKTPQNELYRYKYADLTTIISCTRPALSKNGICFTQGIVPGGFSTLLLHESGQTLATGFVPCQVPTGGDMKLIAGLMTYVKRISLTAALGVSADEDVDAGAQEGSEGNQTSKVQVNVTSRPAAAPAARTAPANHAPGTATAATNEMITNLAIDRQIPEGILNQLVGQGYGYTAKNMPEWVGRELIALLEKDTTNVETVKGEIGRVQRRREAAKAGAK